MKDKLVFGIRSCLVHPHSARHKECLDTWGKHAKEQGYSVKVLLGDPTIEEEYKCTPDYIWSRAKDEGKDEMFEKSILYPSKWFLDETDYEYFFITDNDSFVDVSKFIENLEDVIEERGEVDYMGCCMPYRGWSLYETKTEAIEEKGFYASGGSGFLLSRKAARILVDNFDAKNYQSTMWDDLIAGKILFENGINLLHNGRMLFASPFCFDIHNAEGEEIPYIGDETGRHLVVQHYVDGKMEEINKFIKNK